MRLMPWPALPQERHDLLAAHRTDSSAPHDPRGGRHERSASHDLELTADNKQMLEHIAHMMLKSNALDRSSFSIFQEQSQSTSYFQINKKDDFNTNIYSPEVSY